MDRPPDRIVQPGFGPQMDRRNFLKSLSLLLGLVALDACKVNTSTLHVPRPEEPPQPTQAQYSDVPPTPDAPPDPTKLQYFTVHEARILDALVDRMLPGTPSDPGARDAGVVTYIDNKMTFHEGFATPTYMHPPFVTSVHNVPAPSKGTPMSRYGFQSPQTPRSAYRAALAALDGYAQSRFSKGIAALSAAQLDQVVAQMEAGKIDVMKEPKSDKF
ncbi:MAG TPA: gluconate 2-dehydrogenase subunit 3 family protein, partial [Deinococcales bacterium]|nr:gluconate 2-dehydrogenase subunit 3 family protein [Deinococcales bacterium]